VEFLQPSRIIDENEPPGLVVVARRRELGVMSEVPDQVLGDHHGFKGTIGASEINGLCDVHSGLLTTL
jgi:hypothetical protein